MIKELIPFQKRLNRQALFHSMGLAAAAGTAIGTAVLLGYRLMTGIQRPPQPLAASGLSAVLIFFILYFFIYRSDEKKTAEYLDRLGLQERTMTMLMNKSKTDPLSCLQRKDALAHIATIDPKSIAVHAPVRSLIALVILIIIFSVLMLLPGPYLKDRAAADAAQLRTQEAQLVDQLLDELRQRIMDSSLSEERRQELLAWLETLSGDQQIDMKQLADIIAEAQSMEQRIEDEESYGAVLAEMLAQPHFYQLAKAIMDADIDEMNTYFDELEASLFVLEQEPLCAQLLQIRSEAMSIHARAEEDEGDTTVTGAFTQLSSGFYLAAVGGFSHEDTLQLVHEDLFQCRLSILAMLQAMNSSGSDSLDSERGQTDVSAQQNTHEENGTAAGKTDQDENGLIGGGIDGIASESLGSVIRFNNPDESIWDPDRKEIVPYRDVYGKYYLQLLDGMESGLWNEDTYREISTYFNGL